MSARDKIVEVLAWEFGGAADDEADLLISKLLDAGYVILSQSELQAIRDEALESAAAVVERLLKFADTTSEADIIIAEAIRALKSRPALARAEQPE